MALIQMDFISSSSTGGGIIKKLGTNLSTFDVSTVYNNYANLTNDNFLIVYKTISVSANSRYSNSGASCTGSQALTLSYNPSTGALSIGGTGKTATYSDSIGTYISTTASISYDVYLIDGIEIEE